MYMQYLRLVGVFVPLPIYIRIAIYFIGAYVVSGGILNFEIILLGLLSLAAWLANTTALDIYGRYETDQRRGRGDTEGLIVLNILRAAHVQAIVIASALAALTFVAVYGFLALGLMLAMLGVSYAYASPQLALSSRPVLAAALIPLGYVVLPILLGSLAAAKLPNLLLLALTLACYGQFAISIRSSFNTDKSTKLL